MESDSIGFSNLNPLQANPALLFNPPYSKDLTPENISPHEPPSKGLNQIPDLESFPPLPNLQNLSAKVPPCTPDPNPWKNAPLLASSKPKKFLLKFIPPVMRDNNLVGMCQENAVAGELQILDNTLVGFFLGKKPSFSYVRSNLLKQWKLNGAVEVLKLLHGGLAFRFSNLEDRDLILETGVFYVGGQPFFLRAWERTLHSGGILGLKYIPLWVSLPGLPLHLWGEESLSAACSVLGKPLYTDRITAEKSRWAFARACVEFSGANPLLDTITIVDDVGNVFEQPVKYDWQPPQCLVCGVFGHAQDTCKRGSSDAIARKEEMVPEKNNERSSKRGNGETEKENEDNLGNHGKSAVNGIPNMKDSAAGSFPTMNGRKSGVPGTQLLQGFIPVRVRSRLPSRVKKANPTPTVDHYHGSDPFSDLQSPSVLSPLHMGQVTSGEPHSSGVSAYFAGKSNLSPLQISNSNRNSPQVIEPICSNRFEPLVGSEVPSNIDPPFDQIVTSPAEPSVIRTCPEGPTKSSAGHTPHPKRKLSPDRPNPPMEINSSTAQTHVSNPVLNPLCQNLPVIGSGRPGPPSPSPISPLNVTHPWPLEKQSTYRESTPSKTSQDHSRKYPLPLRPPPPLSSKKFPSITPVDLEALMAPPIDIPTAAWSDEDERDEDEREEESEQDLVSPRAVETWADLEASLKNPQKFFRNDEQEPYNLF